MSFFRFRGVCLCRITALLALLVLVGCEPSKPDTQTTTNKTANNDSTSEKPMSEGSVQPANEAGKQTSEEKTETGPVRLGDLLDPFTPPSLEELEKQVVWKEQPVLDSMVLRREAQAKEAKPKTTLPEALKLKNDSPEANRKLLDVLGRIAENDAEINYDAEINRHSAGDVNSTFPLFISSSVEFEVVELISFGLFGFDWNFNRFAAKDGVVSWHKSDDGLYDKVVLRDDLTWSDGKPITAHDVKFSFQAIMTKAIPVKAQRQGTDQIKWIEAYDDRTVVFFHKESLATNDNNLNFSIIPKHAYEETILIDPLVKDHPRHIELNSNPIAGGAYTVKSRTDGQEIILERRESYYMHKGKQVREKPAFKTIRFRVRPDDSVSLLALKAGDIDEMILSPELWENQTTGSDFYERNTKVYDTEWTSFHFVWNCKDPLFEDKRVRWAMTYAFDHRELLEKHLFKMCEPCTGTFHPISQWAPVPAPKPVVQNEEKAEELLDAAGWTDSDGDGVRDKKINGKKVDFDFTILSSNKEDRIAMCNLLKESLQPIGIRVTVKPLEFAALINNLHEKKFQAAFGGWGTGIDPDSTENIYKTKEERNYGSYSNTEVDELFAAGKRELDPEKRRAIYQKLALLLWDDQPYTWLYYRNAFYGFNKELRGYKFSPRGPYNYGPGFSSVYKPAAH